MSLRFMSKDWNLKWLETDDMEELNWFVMDFKNKVTSKMLHEPNLFINCI